MPLGATGRHAIRCALVSLGISMWIVRGEGVCRWGCPDDGTDGSRRSVGTSAATDPVEPAESNVRHLVPITGPARVRRVDPGSRRCVLVLVSLARAGRASA